jgi:alpha-1,2-mannosyltransferase
MRGRTRQQVLIVAVSALAVAGFVGLVAVHRGFFDLNVYYGALNYWVRDGGQLYDYLRPRTEYGFTYPPFAALTMLPMALVPWPVAIVISALLTITGAGLVLYWYVGPLARRQGWTVWFAVALAACLAAAFEPMRETFSFGQVNAVLLALVAGDALLLVRRGSRWGGVGIGLATAIKLTPGLFVVYLLVTGRRRAAAVAAGTAAAATLLAGAVAPDASRVFWTDAIWDTSRVGDLSYISNQSLQGVLARLGVDPGRVVWLVCVLAVLGLWAWRVRRAVRAGDELAGVALTGVAGCLVSPVTWVHHLVWLIPELVLLVDAGLRTRRRALLLCAAAGYAVLCSRLVWAWRADFGGLDGFLVSNAYVWISLALLIGLPVGERAGRGANRQGVADLVEVDRLATGAVHPEAVPLPVRD